MITRRILVALLVLACGAIPASATLATYSDAASFAAATIGQTSQFINFPTNVSGTSYTDLTSQVVFSDSGGTSILEEIAAPIGWPAGNALEATHCSNTNTCVTTLTITLPTAVTSVSMYLGPQDFNQFQVTLSNAGMDTFSHGLTQTSMSTPVFFGATSDSPFTTFTIATESYVDGLTIDNMEIGTSAGDTQTPEAATFLMIGSGLVMLHFGRRWLPRAA